MSPRTPLLLAAISGMLSVILGAFGAHGLNDTKYLEKKYADTPDKIIAGMTVPASWKYFRDFETAVDYQLAHTAALLACGLLMQRVPGRMLNFAVCSFTFGILLFCGSLYLLVICGPRFMGVPWGMVAPLGGTLLILGWLFLGLHCRNIGTRTLLP
jgi:uncharacterized membrane protein YgdD (TMEM256/DUF423 family)